MTKIVPYHPWKYIKWFWRRAGRGQSIWWAVSNTVTTLYHWYHPTYRRKRENLYRK